jgi:hypothetical protein
MKTLRIFSAATLLVCLFFSTNTFAVIDNNAAVVKLRKSCAEGSTPLMDNCFTTRSALVNWISSTRMPTAASPLLVEIGPGTFGGGVSFDCNEAWGYTTFRGAGMDQTILTGYMTFYSCTKMNFSALTVQGPLTSYGAIEWDGGGESTWTNVRVISNGYAWYAQGCGPVRGSHYWFNSRINNVSSKSSLASGYFEICDESWLFGTEITTTVQAGAYPAQGGAVNARGPGIIHVYGSVLRAFVDGAQQTSGVNAAFASDGGEVHVHGTGIDVISNTGANIVALSAITGGKIHADVSAYNMRTSGTITRIAKDANPATDVHAPYQWQHIPTSPLVSVTGADMTTETVGTDTNLLVYNSQCTGSGGPWYNVVLRTCR